MKMLKKAGKWIVRAVAPVACAAGIAVGALVGGNVQAASNDTVTVDMTQVQTDAVSAMNTTIPLGVKIFAGLTMIGIAITVIRKLRRG